MKKDKKIQVTTAAFSDVGKIRKFNEDSYYISQDENLIIVCDGMGGQVAGGLASKIAVETIKDVFYGLQEEQLVKIISDIDLKLGLSTRRLVAAVRIANRRLFKIASKFPQLRGMGTTVAALTFDKSAAAMVHVGDSRIFRISDGEILQLTEDHSWLNELIEDNEINEEQIETFGQKNVITRALGTGPSIKIDTHSEKYKKDDIYILCTDGLHNSVESEEIKRLFQEKNETLEDLIKTLIETAKVRDGSDNITIAVAKIKENSKNTQQVGISTTIPEEDEKVLSKEDKLIQDHYGDPKLKLVKRPQQSIIKSRNIMLTGLALSMALFGFFLGIIFQPIKLNSNTHKLPFFSVTKNAISTESVASKNKVDKVPAEKASKKVVVQKPNLNPLTPIKRSKVSQDAVLAFVFFNSVNDYNNAMLAKRGLVLDKFYPYKNKKNNLFKGNFSIFLIDSSSNVLSQSTGIQLPPIAKD
ncbi:MAG: Stp1/IreP family PP2C-type Ser/Thr phosphatase [bacterium]